MYFCDGPIDDAVVRLRAPLELAYAGDAVYEMMTRAFFMRRGAGRLSGLHKSSVAFVRAGAQAAAAAVILPLLSPEEEDIFRRGRNAKTGSIPKRATQSEYAQATALEALFGYLYLTGRRERLEELFRACLTSAGLL